MLGPVMNPYAKNTTKAESTAMWAGLGPMKSVFRYARYLPWFVPGKLKSSVKKVNKYMKSIKKRVNPKVSEQPCRKTNGFAILAYFEFSLTFFLHARTELYSKQMLSAKPGSAQSEKQCVQETPSHMRRISSFRRATGASNCRTFVPRRPRGVSGNAFSFSGAPRNRGSRDPSTFSM